MKRTNSSNFKGISFSIALISLFLTGSLTSFAQNTKPDFSGNWAFNKDKSQVGEGRQGPAINLLIAQKDNNLSIERTSIRQDQEFKTTDKFTMDGKESENPAFGDNMKKSTISWDKDGKCLIINSKMSFEMNGNTMEITTTENYKLSADGKILTLDFVSVSSRGERKYTAVYDKK
jgi:hypothetical protein